MDNLGDNGKPYEDNWKIHEKLVENVQERMGQLQQQIAVRDGIAGELKQSRESGDRADIKSLEAQLSDSDSRVELRRAQLAEAYQKVGEFEWSTGPRQAAWLEEGLKPDGTKLEKAEQAAERVNRVMEVGEQAKFAFEVARAFTPVLEGSAHDPSQMIHGHQTEVSRPAPEQPGIETLRGLFSDERVPDLKDVSKNLQPDREQIKETVEKTRQGNEQIDKAISDAPSRGPPGSKEDMMLLEKLHENSRARLEDGIAKEQQAFEQIHDRRGTDPALVNGLQKMRNQENDYVRDTMAKNQENERKDVAEHGLSDNRRREAQELVRQPEISPMQR